MNNRGNQTTAFLLVIVLAVFAWDLGRKQAMNSFLVSTISSTTPTLVEKVFSSGNSDKASVKGKDMAEKIFSLIASGESVKVEDQPAGKDVQVLSLLLSETGWVGVRDSDGRVLGAGRFDAGSFKNVAIPLLRATVAGESYQVLLYADDGDREFDLHKDILITGSNGGVAGTNFKAL